MAYTDTAKIQARLNLSGRTLTASEISYLNSVVIPAIDAYINKQTGTQFGSEDSTAVYESGTGTDMLIIPTMHTITAVETVDDEDTETAYTDYVAYPRGEQNIYALRSTSGTWDEGFENYKITGVLGYVDIPGDITDVANDIAINALGTDKVREYKSEKVGDWWVVYNDADSLLSEESRSVLASYKRLSRRI